VSASGVAEPAGGFGMHRALALYLRHDSRRVNLCHRVAVLLAVFKAAPLWILIQDSVDEQRNRGGDVTGWTIEHFVKLFTTRERCFSIWNSLVSARAAPCCRW